MREAVLVMSYGTPATLDDVEAYYTHIRRGNPPPPHLLEELVERYRAVGGPTALNRITRAQAAALADELGRRGLGPVVEVAFKHVAPFIGDVVRDLGTRGVERVVGIVLAPHYSVRSIAEYERYAGEARLEGMLLEVVRTWHDHPGFVAFLAERLAEARAKAAADPVTLFTAHSVPEAVLEAGDPYPVELRRTCELVAERLDLPEERWTFAYQSAGATDEPWLGPDVLDVVRRLADRGETDVVVQSIGFVSDHLEVLYDLDLEVRRAAEARGMRYARAAMPNVHPDFVAALADVVEPRLAAGTSVPYGGPTAEGVG